MTAPPDIFVIIFSTIVASISCGALWQLRKHAQYFGRRPLWLAGALAWLVVVGLYGWAFVLARSGETALAQSMQDWNSLLAGALFSGTFVYSAFSLKRLVDSDRTRMETLATLKTERDTLEERVLHRTASLRDLFSNLESTRAQLSEYADALDRQIEFAVEVQQSIVSVDELPSYCEVATFYSAPDKISGDFLRVRTTTNESLVRAFIGDAMGHGISAAFLTMLISAGLERTDPELPPFIALGELNDMLNTHRTNLHVTGLLMTMDDQGNVHFSSAGHPTPVLIKADGVVHELSTNGGFALGMFESDTARYEQMQLRLDVGDKILLFTDGVSERRMADGEVFGTSGIVQFAQEQNFSRLDSEEIVQRLQAQADQYEHYGKPDDSTILVIGRAA